MARGVGGQPNWLASMNSCWIRTVESRDAQFVDSVVSNLCRVDHTALEKAGGIGSTPQDGMSRQEMADECGYSLGWIDQHLSLLRLEPEVQALMDPERPKEKQLTFSFGASTRCPFTRASASGGRGDHGSQNAKK